MAVIREKIKEIRPRLDDEFNPGTFAARTETIAEAYRWGQSIHAGQTRLDGQPYFDTHCAWVGAFLDRLVGSDAWTIAGLLHDAVEDQGLNVDEIRAKFPGKLGDDVAHIVDGVTKISHHGDREMRDIETLRKIAMFRDPGVFIVKLADKSHNLMTLEPMPEPRRTQKAIEAIRAYGKLAGIMNCYKWRRWLEDMAFPYAEPDTCAFVKPIIDSDPRLQPDFINPYIENLADLMEQLGLDGRVSIIVNGYWRAWQKLRQLARARKSSLRSFAAVSDMVSFRLALSGNNETECYHLLAAVNRFFSSYLDSSKFIDYIAHPQNRYRALHTAAWLPDYGYIEISIATEEMEGENLWGVVYALKNGKDITGYRPVEIFTPRGSARFLPEGSTVLDAVASIQQEYLLDKISLVQVNGKMARLPDLVHPGDVVEVITSGNRIIPTEEWINYGSAATGRLVQGVLASVALRRAAEEGRVLVKDVLRRKGLLALEDIQALEADRWDNLLEHLASASLEDLYAAVGGGAIRLVDLEQALEEIGINKKSLQWTTISLTGGPKSHRPGVLARLAGMVSNHGGNILRSVNNTLPNGGFALRLVVQNLDGDKEAQLEHSFKYCGIELDSVELV